MPKEYMLVKLRLSEYLVNLLSIHNTITYLHSMQKIQIGTETLDQFLVSPWFCMHAREKLEISAVINNQMPGGTVCFLTLAILMIFYIFLLLS